MTKFILLLLIIGLVAALWLGQRRKAVRQRMEAEQKALPTPLVECPKCGVYAKDGEHRCD